MKHAIATFLFFAAAWVVWSGHFEPLVLAFGFGSCLLVLLIAKRMQILDRESLPYHLGLRPLLYFPWLFWQVVTSNFAVARLILMPRLALSPRLFFVRPSQTTAVGHVIYANSITLTPGTVTLDIRQGRILVHALTETSAYDLIQGEMDRRARWLEGPAEVE